jgi:tetratricopeptide (TPR) repeat protein
MDERAFKEYQKALTKYPKLDNYSEIQQRQFEIANRYLGGQWFKLWGYIPFFPSMDRTAKLFDQVNKNGPYSEIGPKALMNIGAAREKQKDFRQAVRAYERAADKYYDRPKVGADAMYAAGIAWNRLARRAEYDQSIAGNAINFLNDFKALYPDDQRSEEATKIVSSLKTEQARGALKTAEFYEKYKRYQGALVYYNEALRPANGSNSSSPRHRNKCAGGPKSMPANCSASASTRPTHPPARPKNNPNEHRSQPHPLVDRGLLARRDLGTRGRLWWLLTRPQQWTIGGRSSHSHRPRRQRDRRAPPGRRGQPRPSRPNPCRWHVSLSHPGRRRHRHHHRASKIPAQSPDLPIEGHHRHPRL